MIKSNPVKLQTSRISDFLLLLYVNEYHQLDATDKVYSIVAGDHTLNEIGNCDIRKLEPKNIPRK